MCFTNLRKLEVCIHSTTNYNRVWREVLWITASKKKNDVQHIIHSLILLAATYFARHCVAWLIKKFKPWILHFAYYLVFCVSKIFSCYSKRAKLASLAGQVSCGLCHSCQARRGKPGEGSKHVLKLGQISCDVAS